MTFQYLEASCLFVSMKVKKKKKRLNGFFFFFQIRSRIWYQKKRLNGLFSNLEPYLVRSVTSYVFRLIATQCVMWSK